MSKLKKLLADKTAAQGTISGLYAAIKDDVDVQQAKISEIDREIESIINDPVSGARLQQGKDTGTINVVIDGVTVKHDLPKTVKWDQKRLAEVWNNILEAGDNPSDYIKTEYSIEEKKYTALPPSIQAVFLPAREVKSGKPKITFDMGDDE